VSLLVHLTPATNVRRILRSGIRMTRGGASRPAGVFAMPVTRNFYVSHQWLRELKRSGARSISAVYFRVPDTEPILLGHYGRARVAMPASEAAAAISAASNAEGFELLVPRRIAAGEIHRVRELPQVLGWRYFPGAHGTKPCGCPACLPKGEMKSRAIRERYEKGG